MRDNQYPLVQLVRIKERRLEEAERTLKKKKEALEKEQEKLEKIEAERNQAFRHKEDKTDQMREELDKGTTSDKIEMMRGYIKVVQEELKQKEKNLESQKKQVDEAKKAVDMARKEMLKKQQDVEKLKAHRKEWRKEMKALKIQQEGIETDELGTAMHTSKKHKR